MLALVLLQAVPIPTPVPSLIPHLSSWQDPITVSTVVIAVSTVVSMTVSIFMWSATRRTARVTRDIFEAAHRPYIAIEDLSGLWMQTGDHPVRVSFAAKIKNSGSVPGSEVMLVWQIFTANDVLLKQHTSEEHGTVLLPEGERAVDACLDLQADTGKAWLENKIQLNITVTLAYKGVTKKDHGHKQQATYSKSNKLTKTGASFF